MLVTVVVVVIVAPEETIPAFPFAIVRQRGQDKNPGQYPQQRLQRFLHPPGL